MRAGEEGWGEELLQSERQRARRWSRCRILRTHRTIYADVKQWSRVERCRCRQRGLVLLEHSLEIGLVILDPEVNVQQIAVNQVLDWHVQ